MKLRFIYTPVSDLATAKAFYVDVLGAEIVWEEGALTCAVMLPGDHVPIMLDQDTSEVGSGPFYVVPSVTDFLATYEGRIKVIRGPSKIPPGMYAIFEDADGNALRVMDDTTSRERTGS
jgi:predicted enzyme related to lactoylglutathione lyase